MKSMLRMQTAKKAVIDMFHSDPWVAPPSPESIESAMLESPEQFVRNLLDGGGAEPTDYERRSYKSNDLRLATPTSSRGYFVASLARFIGNSVGSTGGWLAISFSSG